jgi:hypothetical protein
MLRYQREQGILGRQFAVRRAKASEARRRRQGVQVVADTVSALQNRLASSRAIVLDLRPVLKAAEVEFVQDRKCRTQALRLGRTQKLSGALRQASRAHFKRDLAVHT